MTARNRILRDLLTSPSTTDSIRDHTDIPTERILSILLTEQAQGLVETRQLKMLTIWSLTLAGHTLAKTLKTTPKQY